MQLLTAIGGVFCGTLSGTQHSKAACRCECLEFFIRRWRFRPSKPPLAAASSGGPRGTACPGRLAPGSGGPARSRTFKSAGDCPGNHRPLSSVQDGGAFSGAAIGCQRAAGVSRRGGGLGGGRSRADQTLFAREYGSGETSCADTFLSDGDLCISQRT